MVSRPLSLRCQVRLDQPIHGVALCRDGVSMHHKFSPWDPVLFRGSENIWVGRGGGCKCTQLSTSKLISAAEVTRLMLNPIFQGEPGAPGCAQLAWSRCWGLARAGGMVLVLPRVLGGRAGGAQVTQPSALGQGQAAGPGRLWLVCL